LILIHKYTKKPEPGNIRGPADSGMGPNAASIGRPATRSARFARHRPTPQGIRTDFGAGRAAKAFRPVDSQPRNKVFPNCFVSLSVQTNNDPSMEFEGVVYKIMPVTKGTSARGDWQRQDVVFEMPGEFSRKICVTFFNKESEVAKLREGAAYTVSVNIESREYNGRWYTDVRAWRIQPKQPQNAPDRTPIPDLPPLDTAPAQPAQNISAAEADDLPF